VARVLYQFERFGLLDGGTGVAGPRPDIQDLKGPDAAITERVAEEGSVLLRNQDKTLPLGKRDLRNVAVIGPTGRQLMVNANQGERARGFPDRDAVSPLDALQSLAPAGASFHYAPGIDWFGQTVPASALAPGLTRTESDSDATQVDATLDYPNSGTLSPGVTYTWTGSISVPADDTYYLLLQQSYPAGGGFFAPPSTSLQVDGATPPSFTPAVLPATYPSSVIPATGANTGAVLSLTAGSHTISVKTAVPATATGPVQFRLAWSRLSTSIAGAVAAARSAKVAVVFVDDNGAASSDIVNSLAPNEDALVAAVAAVNPRTVVVASTGDPVLTPWIENVKSLLEVWYPGQEGSTAIARLLLGQANPAGRTPITWPVDAAQTPFAGHPERIDGADGAVTFSEGLFMGYRWYDQQHLDPRFAFGFGLSYSTFRYSKPAVSRSADGGVDVTFRVRNASRRAGDEVPQVYVGPAPGVPAGVQQAVRKLVGFDRIHLDARRQTQVTIHVPPRQLSYWSVGQQRWILAAAGRAVYVGSSSRDTPLTGTVGTS
jgi:beta-glucosidase